MNYKKIYCDKWKGAYANNTVVDNDDIVELRWKNIPVGWMSCGPVSTVFTKLYYFKGDPELLQAKGFPGAEKDFNCLLANVGKMESICQLWHETDTKNNTIELKTHDQLLGRIVFNHGKVTYEGKNGNGWNTSDDPDVMIKFSTYISNSTRDNEIRDDLMLIASLGKMIKK